MKSGSLLNLGRQTIIYGLSGAAIQVVGLITLPVFARAFSPAEYGVIEIASVTFAFLGVCADAGLASASQRSYFDYGEEDARQRRSVLATALIASTLFATSFAMLLILLRDPVADFLFAGQRYATVIVLVAVSLPLSVLVNLSREAMRLRFRAWHYVASSAIAVAVSAGVGLGLVLAAGVGVEALFIGIVAGNLASSVYGFLVTRRDFAGPPSRPELRTMLLYGIPLIPVAVANWGLSFLDRLMLAQLDDLDAVGQYALATRVGSVLLFAVTAFAVAFSPFILSLYQEDPAMEREVRGRAIVIVTTGFLIIAVVLSLFAREIIEIVAPAFDEGYRAVGPLALGLAAFGSTTMTMTGIALARRTSYLAAYSLLAVAINVVLNFILIPPFGIVGAALGTLGAFLALTLLYQRMSQRLSPANVASGALVRVTILSAAIIPLGAIAFSSTAVGLGVKFAALCVYVLGVYLSGIVHRDEIARLRTMVSARLDGTRPA